ncbi:LysR family transcriptional regulator [Sedimenticola sp.]|uniref:LysR family transcriptional regulator n=1 Tax=Sedimenticola sp. TaxID=1940285 RepID=UPI003D12652B
MKIDHLESFYHVVQQGGFSAAAEYLGVSKGLVSRHVRSLETTLNAKLLHRTTRVVNLTESGQHLYQHAIQIFSLAKEAEQVVQDLTQEASGILRFTAPITLGERVLGDLLPPFWEQCPQVKVETNFTSKAFKIVDGDQDIALRAYDTLPENVVAKSVGQLRNMVVASPDYVQRMGAPNSPIDLHQHPCILFKHVERGSHWLFESADTKEIVSVNGPLSVSQYSTARHMALTGFGIANLPYYQVEQDIQQGRLEALLTDTRTYSHDLYILHASHLYLPKKLRLFKELLSEWFTQNRRYLLED